MRPPIQRYDAGVVDLLVENRDVSGTLLDLKIGIVSWRQHRRSFMRHHDAPLAQTTAFRAIIRAYFFPLLSKFCQPLLRFRSQGRNLSIRRIHDQGSPHVESMLSLRPVQPVLMEIVVRDRPGDFLGTSGYL